MFFKEDSCQDITPIICLSLLIQVCESNKGRPVRALKKKKKDLNQIELSLGFGKL